MISFKEQLDHKDLYPLTLIRRTEELFSGAFTNVERWKAAAEHFSLSDLHEIPSHIVPIFSFWKSYLEEGLNKTLAKNKDYITIKHKWDFIQQNQNIIKADIQLRVLNNKFQNIPDHITVTGLKDQVYLEEGATLEQASLNTTQGPIYIGENSLIMDGARLRGPLYIGKNCVVKMNATIYGGTSIRDKVIIGGEVKNSIINSYSNKAHDGYLGDSIIGEWCNLGAGTTVSNLKNNASEVGVWNMFQKKVEYAGNKCGTFMGDFSRTGINTSLDTGTVIGICSNIIPKHGRPPKFIPNFSWLNDELQSYNLDKAFVDIQNWMNFKNEELTTEMKFILTSINKNKYP